MVYTPHWFCNVPSSTTADELYTFSLLGFSWFLMVTFWVTQVPGVESMWLPTYDGTS